MAASPERLEPGQSHKHTNREPWAKVPAPGSRSRGGEQADIGAVAVCAEYERGKQCPLQSGGGADPERGCRRGIKP